MEHRAVCINPERALAVYAASLVARGVVVVLGDASNGLGELLVELGARIVHVWDPDAARARTEAERAPRGVTVRALGRDPVESRGVDLVLIPDLGVFAAPYGSADVLSLARRMVGEVGTVILAAANRDVAADPEHAFDYYELFDRVAGEFDCVRMIAELTFQGVTLVELGEDEGAESTVSVDTLLAEKDRPPELFIALASQRDVRLDPYSIVELPAAPSPPAEPAEETPDNLEALREAAAAVAALQALLVERTRELEALAQERSQLLASVRVGHLAAAEAEETARRAERAERRAATLEQELAHAEAAPAEHARLEETLRERAQSVRDLEAELERREHMIRELAGALEEAAVPPAVAGAPPVGDDENVRLRERLDALARDIARREGEAQATSWTLAELERRLTQASAPAADPATEGRLSAALDELTALRSALVQEHEARLRAESGEELSRARDEIKRQAGLLEQLVKELEAGARGGEVAQRLD